jgi:hypothetical protein
VHTVYVAADRFAAGTATAYGAEALRLLDAPGAAGAALAAALGLDDPARAAAVRERVAANLDREPVETCGSTSRTATGSATTPTRTGTRPWPPPRSPRRWQRGPYRRSSARG